MSSDWRDRAACLGMDTNLFYPDTYAPVKVADQRRLRMAMATCEDCPVRPECLAYAIGLPERYGIWGGVGEHARKARAANARRRKARATAPALT